MSDEKILSIQEKIQLEKEKIQNRVRKNDESSQKIKDESKIVEKLKIELKPRSIEETKSRIKSEIEQTPYIAPQVARYDDGYSSRRYSSSPSASTILGGIFVMIVGFATLTIGNYLVSTIAGSLPAISDSNMNSAYTNSTNEVISYVSTVLPLFGLGAMVMGFAVILFTLRSGMGSDY